LINFLLTLPIIIPMISAVSLLVSRRFKIIQPVIYSGGTGLHLLISIILFRKILNDGIQVTQIGNWPAPYGITLVADLFSAIMILLASITALAVVVFSIPTIDESKRSHGFYPLIHFLLMGVSGSFLTGDIFNLYVWFEVMLMASFVLMVLGGERPQLEGALKYVTLNLLGSTFFLVGVGILYGKMGTLNMADLAVKLQNEPQSDLLNSSAMLFFIAFGIKAAVFPFFFWLPASYHTPPPAVSAIFSGLLTKVGIYAMIRVFTLIFIQHSEFTHGLILVIAALTMVVGVLGAAGQYEIRRILSFHIVSQIGYMLMGLGLFTPLGLAGAVFYIIHHIIVKSTLFLMAGVIYSYTGSYSLKEVGDLYRKYPLVSLAFFLPAMSLAGVPPLSGFWAKFVLIKAGLSAHNFWIVLVALLVSLITLYSMTKIWAEGFWKASPVVLAEIKESRIKNAKTMYPLWIPVISLIIITVVIGLSAELIFQLSQKTAEQLLNTSHYIRAVLESQ
jgi:multicomponent Na+:H+ antiporter subunit D